MILLNFAHPITPEQLAQVEDLAALAVERVIDVPVQIDTAAPLGPQAEALVDACGITADVWQTADLLVNPPGLASAALALVAEIHGRRGSFPALMRTRPIGVGALIRYEIAELVNLQALRDDARQRRWPSEKRPQDADG